MRVALVAPLVTPIVEPQRGGSQAVVADLARGLVRRGHEVTVYASLGSSIEGVRVVDVGCDPDELTETLFRHDADVPASDAARAAFEQAYELVAADRPEVVHNHAFDVPAFDLAPTDVPVVHTLHLPPTASMSEAVGRARGRKGRLVTAAVSEWSAAAWRACIEVDAVLRNGVPTGRIPWSEEGGEGLLFAGRLSPEKGAAEAIETARAARLSITVVGGRYDEDYARERVDPYTDHDAVVVHDPMTRRRLWQLMARSRALLFPALWDEPFGLVAAEAQAAGTPVVAYDRGALSEVVRHGKTGFLVDGVAQAVEALGRIGEIERSACRRPAARALSLEAALDAHEALYESLVPMGASR